MAGSIPLSREQASLLAVILLTLGFTILPYLLGYLLAPADMAFTGLVMNPEDSLSYFAKMLQGYDGRWLYSIPFTPEEHAPAFVGAFYIALGHAARWLSISLGAMWHLARIIANIFLLLATFLFVSAFIRDSRMRWTAYLLAVFGSGLGWLLFLLGKPYWLGAFPVDFKMPEAHLFFTSLTFPHVALGTGLLLVSFWLLTRTVAVGRHEWLYASLAGLVNLTLSIVYPFLIFLVIATIALYWLYLSGQARRVLWRYAGLFSITILIPIPLLVYYVITLETNAMFRAWSDQSLTLSPPWPHYIIAFGVLLLLALLSILQRTERPAGDDSMMLLWSWVGATVILVYMPLNSQRRFVQGIQVPLTILATIGLFYVVLPGLRKTRVFRWLIDRPRYTASGLERLFIAAFLIVMSLSNIYLLADVSVTAAIRQPFPFFRKETELAATDWVRANTSRSDVVLAAYETGNYLAAHAGNRVVIGHWAETLNWHDKSGKVERFYSASEEDTWRREFLEHYKVQYVWFGPQERMLGDFSPEQADYLRPVYTNADVQLYSAH